MRPLFKYGTNMKFAFLIMGDFNPEKDRAEIHGGNARIIGVSSVDEGCRVAENLISEGIGCIELCGAFSPSDAEKIVIATGNRIPIGYTTHLPIQDDVYRKAFGS